MAFIIPNLADAAHSVQAAIDAVDVGVMVQGFSGTGVISGCTVSANSGLQVAVASGVIMVAGTVVSITGVNVSSAAAHASLPRFDLVVANSSGVVSISGGTANATPAFPTVPANSVALAVLWIGAAQVTTSSSEITDKRVILLNTMNVGVSTGGNSAGHTGVFSNRVVLAGGSNITLSGSSQSGSYTLSIHGANIPVVGSAIQDISNATNSGTATSQFAAHDHTHRGLRAYNVQGVASTFFGNVQFSAGNNMALSTAGNTTAGSVAFHNVLSTATTVSGAHSVNVVGAVSSRFALEDHRHSGVQTMSMWRPGNILGGIIGASAFGASSLIFVRDFRDQYGSASVADVWLYVSLSTSSNSSWAGAVSHHVGYYTRNGSTLSLASSGSAQYVFSNTSSNSVSLLSDVRRITIPINLNLTPGEYWVANLSMTSSTNANWFTASNLVYTIAANIGSGADFLSSTNASNQFELGWGFGPATAALPASVAFSQITGLSLVSRMQHPAMLLRNIIKA